MLGWGGIGQVSRATGRSRGSRGVVAAVNVYDVPNLSRGKALPYGVYGLRQNAAWVMVGTDHDTAVFAVASIRQWWETLGQATYPRATWLLITAPAPALA